MKIPKTVKIGSRTYRVTVGGEAQVGLDGGYKLGEISYQTGRIWLASSLCGERIADYSVRHSLVHELIHGIDESYNQGAHLSEAQVDAISEGWCQVVADNRLDLGK